MESDDVWLALKLLFCPWRWFRGDARERVEQYFCEWLNVKHSFAFESGRSALYAVLESLHLKHDEEVLLQAYTCVAVPNAVLWAGARPIYVDADLRTFTMSCADLEAKITERSRVLILQHTFGNPAPMKKILDIARAHDLFIIEDCAHSLGAEYQGKKTGAFGHAAFFSFGRDKVISSVFGGLLVTKSDLVAERLQEHFNARPYPRRLWLFRTLLQPIITTLVKRAYGRFKKAGKIILKSAIYLHLLLKQVSREEYHGGKPAFTSKKMASATALLLFKQLEKYMRFNAHRRAIAQVYYDSIQTKKVKLPRIAKESNPAFLRYTILTPRAKELRAMAKRENIFLGDWYDCAIAPCGVDYKALGYHPRECPAAESLARQSLNLPTDINISKEDAKKIAEFINAHA